MDIEFASRRLEALANDTKALNKKYGVQGGKLLKRRFDQLFNSPSLETMRSLPGKCHELKGSRAGQLAVSLHSGFRLVFEPAEEPVPKKEDGGLDWALVTAVRILEVTDYHD